MATRIKHPYPLSYRGNVFILIIGIFFLPLALGLLVKNLVIRYKSTRLYLSYRGKIGWVLFWSLVFFPFAILLLLVRGVDLIEETEKQGKIKKGK